MSEDEDIPEDPPHVRSDDDGSQREVVVPLRLYKTVTVFSTLIAVFSVVGDDTDAKATVSELAEDIEGLRALDGGPLANAAEVEGLTPLLINVARHNDGLHDLGVQFR